MKKTCFQNILRLCALLICLMSFQAKADDGAFAVLGIRVDESAESSVAAREAAFAKGQQAAFDALMQRVLPEDKRKDIVMPEAAVIQTMIQDFEVVDERLSDTRYIATLNYRFFPSKVMNFLSGEGVDTANIADVRPILILPFLQEGEKMKLWDDPNPWRDTWAKEMTKGLVVPIQLPLGDIADLEDVPDQSVLSGQAEGIKRMVARYGTEGAVIAVLSLPAGENKETKILIYRLGQYGLVQETTLAVDTPVSGESFYSDAVRGTSAYLEKNSHAVALPEAQVKTQAQATASFQKLEEWIEIQKRLRQVKGLSDFSVVSLSQQDARLDLNFAGDVDMMRYAMAQHGLKLGLPVMNVDAAGTAPSYDLTLTDLP